MCKAHKAGGKKKKTAIKIIFKNSLFSLKALYSIFFSKSSKSLPNTKHQFSWPDFWQVCHLPQASARQPAEASPRNTDKALEPWVGTCLRPHYQPVPSKPPFRSLDTHLRSSQDAYPVKTKQLLVK